MSLSVISFRTVDHLVTRMQRPRTRPPFTSLLAARSQRHQVTPFDSPLPNCPIRDIAVTERVKQLLADLRRASAMAIPRCIVSHCATAWTECLEGAISGHQSWAVLCRYRCRLLLAEVPKGSDRNAELKLRLQLWETGEISEHTGTGTATVRPAPQKKTNRAATN